MWNVYENVKKADGNRVTVPPPSLAPKQLGHFVSRMDFYSWVASTINVQ